VSTHGADEQPASENDDVGLPTFAGRDRPHGQAPGSHGNIEDEVADVLRAGAFPVVIGGDHSITHPAATAVAAKYGWGKGRAGALRRTRRHR